MIRGARCRCGRDIVPFRKFCPSCGKTMEEVDFEDIGVVLTHTTLHAVPEGFEAPIRLAMIRLEGGANVICMVKDDDEMNIGKKVHVRMDGERYFCETVS
jgi:uncharacterized OB-fold protein